jgi:dihydrofolate synthase/folylpolyglutamate synthase
MTYAQAIEYLYRLRWFGTKFGLANTFKLAELAGNPQRELRFIHVAGTNGKGSTCAMLESICRHAGMRTGLFTSPHLVSFGERIQVDREPIAEDEVVELVEEMQPLLARFPETEHPTFFEVVTVMGLMYFVRRKCEVVIWETGLGGRLDATSIVTPLVSVITNIQYDHQKWLGSTLGEIAFEKAGIIKPGVPVVTATAEPEALEVITRTASERGSALTRVTATDLRAPALEGMELPLRGQHQRWNAALAVKTCRILAASGRLTVSESALRQGLQEVNWPGRLQLIEGPGKRRILLDGAHNLAGVEALVNGIAEFYPEEKPALILGILQDKDWEHMCERLTKVAGKVFFVPVHSERTTDPAVLEATCRRLCPGIPAISLETLAQALEAAAGEKNLVITGSLYLVGEALELLGNPGTGARGERALNEWGTTATPATSSSQTAG